MPYAVHFEDFKVHFMGAPNKEGLFYGGEAMLLIEALRVGGGHHHDWAFVINLCVLDGKSE